MRLSVLWSELVLLPFSGIKHFTLCIYELLPLTQRNDNYCKHIRDFILIIPDQTHPHHLNHGCQWLRALYHCFCINLFIMSQILSRFFNLPIVSIWPICAYSLLHTSQNWYCGLHWSSSSFAPYLEDWSIMQLRNSGNVMLYGWSCGWNLAFEHGWCHLRAKSLSLTVWMYADTNLIQGFLWKHKC